jgi:hypothetical protein
LLKDTINTCIEKKLAMFLHVLGFNHRFRVIHNTWRRTIETIPRYFWEVMYAIGELRGEMIKPPSACTLSPKVKDSYLWFSYFKLNNYVL